jgi:predicted enzyme related to lactoylglutathione lyase
VPAPRPSSFDAQPAAPAASFPSDFTQLSDKESAAMSEVQNNSANNGKINYVEFVSTDILRSKRFYSSAFDWSFVDYGPDYAAFYAAGAGVDGGFRKGEASIGSPLIVLYASDLAATESAIVAAGGTITVPTFEFPGGRRFHFSDGAGNELAVWSE